MTEDAAMRNIEAEAARLEEDALHTFKGHFEAGRGWGSTHYWLGGGAAVLAVVAGAAMLSDYLPLVAGLVAIVVAAMNALITFLAPNRRAEEYRKYGVQFKAIRDETRILKLVDTQLTPGDPQELADRLRNMRQRYAELELAAPQIPRWAYQLAKRGIDRGEATYAVDQTTKPGT